MPDLKSELAKLKDLKFDDEPEAQPQQAPATNPEPENNLTHKIFRFYRDTPMSTCQECVDGLGMDQQSVSARTAQLFKRGALTRIKRGQEAFRYSAAVDSLPSREDALKAALIKANAVKKVNKAKRQQMEKARAAKAVKAMERKVREVQAPAPKPARMESVAFSATSLVAGLTPFQARAVFDELAKLFGGMS